MSALRLFAAQTRALPRRAAVTLTASPSRSLHSPFKGFDAPASSPASRLSDEQAEEFFESDSQFGSRTHVVYQPASSFNQIPLGAYPIATPYSASQSAETASATSKTA